MLRKRNIALIVMVTSLFCGLAYGFNKNRSDIARNTKQIVANTALLKKLDIRDVGEGAAKRWASNIPNATGVACVSVDLNGDGYRSCTVFRGNELPLAIECASDAQIQAGCRLPTGQAPIKKD